jgi:DNA-binding MarR family transcriptional regulator
MHEARWINRCDDTPEKRQSLFSLTAAGWRKLQPLLKHAKALEAQVLSALGTDPAHQLKRMLKGLIATKSSCCATIAPFLRDKHAT